MKMSMRIEIPVMQSQRPYILEISRNNNGFIQLDLSPEGCADPDVSFSVTDETFQDLVKTLFHLEGSI